MPVSFVKPSISDSGTYSDQPNRSSSLPGLGAAAGAPLPLPLGLPLLEPPLEHPSRARVVRQMAARSERRDTMSKDTLTGSARPQREIATPRSYRPSSAPRRR